MGCDLYLRKLKGYEAHPTWDDDANGGNKQFVRDILPGLPKVETKSNDSEYDFDWYVRPSDFAAWRAAIVESGICNQDKFLAMVDALEADAEWHLYVSW